MKNDQKLAAKSFDNAYGYDENGNQYEKVSFA